MELPLDALPEPPLDPPLAVPLDAPLAPPLDPPRAPLELLALAPGPPLDDAMTFPMPLDPVPAPAEPLLAPPPPDPLLEGVAAPSDPIVLLVLPP